MKNTLTLFLLFLFSFNLVYCQDHKWIWAKGLETEKESKINAIKVDEIGNVYAIGSFSSSTIKFDNITLQNSGLGDRTNDIFIVKYDSLGKVIWAKKFGDIYNDEGLSLTIEKNNNIYITGHFNSPTIQFGNFSLNLKDSLATMTSDIFIAKLNESGETIWARSAGGFNQDEGQSVSTDSEGNLYLTGMTTSNKTTFDSLEINYNTTYYIYSFNIFVAKYTSNGNVLWVKKSDALLNDNEGNHIATDSFGNSYIIGQFYSNIIVGKDTFLNKNDSILSDDFILLKYNSQGNLIWSKTEGGDFYDFANDIITDKNGNFYIVGSFNSSELKLGDFRLKFEDSVARWNGHWMVYIAKYNNMGTVLWAKKYGSFVDGADWPRSISLEPNGNIVVAGQYNRNIEIDGIKLKVDVLNYNTNVFIMKTDKDGNTLSAIQFGDLENDVCTSIDTKKNNVLHVGGFFESKKLLFDNILLTNFGETNPFIAKLNFITKNSLLTNNHEKNISIYPNPTLNYTYVNIDNAKNSMLILWNQFGQKVKIVEKIDSEQYTMELKDIPTGIYFLQVINENNTTIVEKLEIIN